MSYHKCTIEMHNRCSNNALCHICDGERLFKDPVAERKEKYKQRILNKEEEKKAFLKGYKKEKKEGMAFEKKVAKAWNQKFGGQNKKAVAKPRLQVPSEEVKDWTPMPADRNATIPTKATYNEAKRQANSGAMWHAKGDIKLEHALMECKERGTKNARGEKTISIPKEWLDKQEKEAFQEQRDYWYLPFGYKGSEDIYLIKPYDHEMEMIYEIRRLRQENEELKSQLKEEE